MQVYRLYKLEKDIVESFINDKLRVHQKLILVFNVILKKKDLLREYDSKVYFIRGKGISTIRRLIMDIFDCVVMCVFLICITVISVKGK